ncbi:MAG: sugar ABC transporter permease, partial [Calditrichia bacterium]
MINKNKMTPYIMVSPYIIHFLAFIAFPVIFSFILMFHRWNIISPMQYIGLGNFDHLFQDRLFFKAILNTIIFLVIHIPLHIIVALFFAEMLNQKLKL